MFSCKNCGHAFRDSYDLTKHMSRKKPCVNKENEKKSSGEKIISDNQPRSSFGKSRSSFGEPRSSFEVLDTSKPDTQKCMYCLNTFSIKSNLKKHYTVCKYREDPVRLLEIERGIKPEACPSKTECRFCNRDYLRIDNLHRHLKVCKDREDYHQILIKQGERQCTIVNNNYNGTVNNTNTINNNTIIINNFGEETLDHISNREFISFIKNFYKKAKLSINDDTESKLIMGNFLIDFERMISSYPSNQNSWITNVKSDYGVIKLNNEEKILRFADFAERVLINTSKKLSDRHDTFSEDNNLDDEINNLLNEACEFRYGSQHYKDLPKKQLKELIDNLRISKIK